MVNLDAVRGFLGTDKATATGIAALLVTGVWLVALFTNQGWWLLALLLGYIVVVPLVAILFGRQPKQPRKDLA